MTGPLKTGLNPTGLRARQKAERDRRILQAAAALFRESGYEGGSIEAIAQAAGVSVGTIYNYYENKGELLLAIVNMEVTEVLAEGEAMLERPPTDPHRAVADLLANYLEHSLVYLSKAMWRRAMAISTQQPESRFGAAYAKLDERLSDQVCRLIERLAADGRLKPGVDARAMGELIFNNTNMMFILFVKEEAMALETLTERISRQNAALLGPWRVGRLEEE